MGAGIAQLASAAGRPTLLYDPLPDALEQGLAHIRADLRRGAKRGLWHPEEADAAAGKLRAATSLEALAASSLVIEAAPEDLGVKKELFARLEEICDSETVLASNTSSLSIAAIAVELRHPERVCGMHFFNPPPRMKLVEIVAGPRTSEAALTAAAELSTAMGRVPVATADAPGFIVNRCNRPYSLEALRMLGDGVASHAQIDTVMRERGGFPMGPFELMDLVGVDISLAVARSFFAQRPVARWEPHPLQEQLVSEGHLGRKTGRGFYDYGGDRIEPRKARPLDDTLAREVHDRILACLVNEASLAVDEGVATEPDIDRAMRLGLNHPHGPFEWRDLLGARQVVATLDSLAERAQNPERYAAAESLRARAG